MGVAFLPLHYYNNPSHPDHGKLCIVLGREIAGSYVGKFNFIGGSLRDHRGGELDGLFAEVAEELGLILDGHLLETCLIKKVRVKGTSFYPCHVTGISSSKWKAMCQKRRSMGLQHKYLEMDAIAHFPVNELRRNPLISQYVRDFIPLIESSATVVRTTQPVHYSQFMRNRCTLRGIPMLS
jgi:hypothetical protein